MLFAAPVSEKSLLGVYEKFAADKKSKTLCLLGDPEKLWEKFITLFRFIEAAGGVVYNKKGKLLMIFRKGKWDLPKGKLEKKERPAAGAAREVEEECGISGVHIGKRAAITYHSYKQSGKEMLKRTYWYKMSYAGNEKLFPQKKEGITKAKWMSSKEVKRALGNSYPLIARVLGPFL